VNWQHLRTLLWLRGRLTVNHIRRYGALNLIILSIMTGLALVASVIGFFVALFTGWYFLPGTSPVVLMYLCDGWVLAFLLFWMIGVMADLQRGELLSLDKLLHLPTTLTEVYLFNFLSSLISLPTLTFVPPMLGLAFAAVLVKGPAALVMFPLLAAFVLMVCAVTYQFRGWLATLMVNKRRQRTVMLVITCVFIVVIQAPQLVHLVARRQILRSAAAGPRDHFRAQEELFRAQQEELLNKLKANEITREEFTDLQEQRRAAESQAVADQMNRLLEAVNLALPIGWIAYGAQAAWAGSPWPGLAGTLGMVGIAAFSLRRSYRTTLRYFTGDLTGHARQVTVAPLPSAATPKARAAAANLVERSLPLVSEPVAAIAWATFCSLTRAPEVKLVLLGPLVMLVVFGAMLLPSLGAQGTPNIARSFLPLGVLGLSIAGLAQLSQNIFAFDRSGFRAYVLSGVPRCQILIGKNLAMAPLVFVPSVSILAIVQCLAPAPVTHFLASLMGISTVYLMLCLLGNLSSILSPVGQAAGSLKPANASGVTMLLQFLFLLATIAVLSVVAVVPIGLEALLQFLGWLPTTVPVALIVATAELAASVLVYGAAIRRQGDLLQSRECRILETVIEKGE
jgi:ABC-2 type transport system permease protein